MKNMQLSESDKSLYRKYKSILNRSIREFQYLGTNLQSHPDNYKIWCKVAQTIK
jgi:hypothetical protein